MSDGNDDGGKWTRRRIAKYALGGFGLMVVGGVITDDDSSSDNPATGSADADGNGNADSGSGDSDSGGSGSGGSDSTDSGSAGSDGTESNETEQPDITILEHDSEEGTLGPKVVGEMKNTSGGMLDYMEVKAYFYDEDDTRIGEGMDNATEVPADEVVAFEIVFTGSGEPAKYELETGTSPL